MGKLSQRDADEMIRGYRVRAIEVIKEIDLVERGGVGTVREEILREVRARLQLDAKAVRKPAAEARPGKATSDAGAEGKPAAKAKAKAGARTDARTEDKTDAAGGAEPVSAVTPDAGGADPQVQAARTSAPRDEELDADSTTALEPRHDEPASQPSKEATP
jgi:hypothetical protein